MKDVLLLTTVKFSTGFRFLNAYEEMICPQKRYQGYSRLLMWTKVKKDGYVTRLILLTLNQMDKR